MLLDLILKQSFGKGGKKSQVAYENIGQKFFTVLCSFGKHGEPKKRMKEKKKYRK